MSKMERNLDHSQGHAFLYGGDIFYSPNCACRISIPVKPVSPLYPFHQRTTRIEQFLQPCWFSAAYSYLPFVPLRPFFVGATFGCLHDSHVYIQEPHEQNFVLGQQTVDDWQYVEDMLILMVYYLKDGFRIPPFLKPIAPSLLGFPKTFSSPHVARRRAFISRNWYGIWMGLLSYLIANVETDVALSNINKDSWFLYLAKIGIYEHVLSGVELSCVNDFSLKCPRAGTILDIALPEPTQPAVEWFCKFGVPVWYPWTAVQRRYAESMRMTYLCPPPDILQRATTFMTRQPSILPVSPLVSLSSPLPTPPAPSLSASPLPSRSISDMSDDEYDKARADYIASEPWAPFFKARSERNQLVLQSETSLQRQARLNRERKPPITSAEVYVWDWSEDDPLKLVRTRVTKTEREGLFGFYKASEQIYDSFNNVWDMCSFFGGSQPVPGDDYDEEFDDDLSDYGPQNSHNISSENLLSEQQHNDSHIESRFEQCKTLNMPDRVLSTSASEVPEVDLTLPSNTLDIFAYITDHYGFLSPRCKNSHQINRNLWDECLKSIGLRAGDHNAPIPGLTHSITTFVQSLQRQESPPNNLWDLSPGHYHSIDKVSLQRTFRKLGNLYVLVAKHFFIDPNTPWNFAFCDADSALYVYRVLQGDHQSTSSLASHLADIGIRFFTLLELESLVTSISIKSLQTRFPTRSAGFTFGPQDFHIYVQQRAQLLASPRGRAALLHGGIVSRIAREHLAPESAGFGPSSAVLEHRLGLSFKIPSGALVWDDTLTKAELAVICGVHRLDTGVGNQVAWVSWWPTEEHWGQSSAGYNWHHWTEWDEVWYQKRLSAILKGDERDGIPIPSAKWRDKLKGGGTWRKVTQFVTSSSASAFL